MRGCLTGWVGDLHGGLKSAAARHTSKGPLRVTIDMKIVQHWTSLVEAVCGPKTVDFFPFFLVLGNSSTTNKPRAVSRHGPGHRRRSAAS